MLSRSLAYSPQVSRVPPSDGDTYKEPPKERRSTSVLSRDIVDAVRSNMEKMQLPSWVAKPPYNWGEKKRGKMSADQWRVLCTINLPLTLIETWARGDERQQAMLKNFMSLVLAVRIASLNVTSENDLVLYERCMLYYLTSMKELYKDAPVKPNHHLALHLGDFLRMLGPVHAYRSFAFERYNYMLQRENTNMKFGE
jgi:hypothetical protein